MSGNTLDKNQVREYLDKCICHWRVRRNNGDPIALHYVDAFQSMRISLFDEVEMNVEKNVGMDTDGADVLRTRIDLSYGATVETGHSPGQENSLKPSKPSSYHDN